MDESIPLCIVWSEIILVLCWVLVSRSKIHPDQRDPTKSCCDENVLETKISIGVALQQHTVVTLNKNQCKTDRI